MKGLNCWLRKGQENILVLKNEAQPFIEAGWQFGRFVPKRQASINL
jgi:hypothetical protein